VELGGKKKERNQIKEGGHHSGYFIGGVCVELTDEKGGYCKIGPWRNIAMSGPSCPRDDRGGSENQKSEQKPSGEKRKGSSWAEDREVAEGLLNKERT